MHDLLVLDGQLERIAGAFSVMDYMGRDQINVGARLGVIRAHVLLAQQEGVRRLTIMELTRHLRAVRGAIEMRHERMIHLFSCHEDRIMRDARGTAWGMARGAFSFIWSSKSDERSTLFMPNICITPSC